MLHADQLSAFVAFGETLSFTQAARRLHISQPALHVQIRKLGETLGTTLYIRRGRVLELTVAGRKLLAFGRDQAERTAELLADLGQRARDTTVVLAAGEGTFLYLLGPALRDFRRSPQQHALRVLTRDSEAAVAAVRLGEAHLAVTAIDDVPDDLVGRRIARVGAALIMPRGHRLARRRSISITALEGEQLIAPARGRPLRAALAHAWTSAGLRFAPAVEASGWQLMMSFAELGLGLAIVNDFCKPPRGLVSRRVTDLPVVHYQLLRRRDRASNSALSALEHAISSHRQLRGP